MAADPAGRDRVHPPRAAPAATLQARGWPAGEAVIDIALAETPGGTEVTVHETPTHGPGAWVNNPLAETVLGYRIREMLDRLGRIAEGHAGGQPQA